MKIYFYLKLIDSLFKYKSLRSIFLNTDNNSVYQLVKILSYFPIYKSIRVNLIFSEK